MVSLRPINARMSLNISRKHYIVHLQVSSNHHFVLSYKCMYDLINFCCHPSIYVFYSEEGLVFKNSVGVDNLLFMNTLNYFAFPIQT